MPGAQRPRFRSLPVRPRAVGQLYFREWSDQRAASRAHGNDQALPTVLLSLAAANRDPERSEDPDRLDTGPDTTGHLALGIHSCCGATLAGTETEIALATPFARLPGPRVAADVGPGGALRCAPAA